MVKHIMSSIFLLALGGMNQININVDILQYYSGGVYSSTQCSSSTLTHAMLVTGYGTDSSGNEYYLVKNR